MNENKVNWGGVFAGSFVTLALAILFGFFGQALGLSPVALLVEGTRPGLSTGIWIYTLLTMSVSFYAGAYVTALITGMEFRRRSIMHGLVTWAFSGVTALLVGSLFSIAFRTGIVTRNWLSFFVALIGAIAASVGAANATRYRMEFRMQQRRNRESDERAA